MSMSRAARRWLTEGPGLRADRQRQIERLAQDGMSSPEIAEALGISVSTVQEHRRRLGMSAPVGAPEKYAR